MTDLERILTDFLADVDRSRRPLTMTITQAAYHLNCGEGRVRKLVRDGRLTSIPGMGVTLFRAADVEGLVNGE